MAVKRLDRLLSELGVATRSELRQMIKSGRVTVDGAAAVRPDMKIEEQGLSIGVDGAELCTNRLRYFMMDKPEGVLSATEDKRQETVLDILPPDIRRIGLFPVGRLDCMSEGLLLFTDDGEMANRLAHPSHGVSKTYRVWVSGPDAAEAAGALRRPIVYEGVRYRAAEVRVLRSAEDRALIDVTIREGKNREVRNMCAAAGLKVQRLLRIRQGEISLGDLHAGQWRYLTAKELEYLQSLR